MEGDTKTAIHTSNHTHFTISYRYFPLLFCFFQLPCQYSNNLSCKFIVCIFIEIVHRYRNTLVIVVNIKADIFMIAILVPNVVFATKNKNGVENKYKNKPAEIFEQIGRYACFALMIFNVPYTYIGFYFPEALTVYLVVDCTLVGAYCVAWLIFWKKNGLAKAIILSAIPSAVFVFSGIMIASIPLIVFSVVFAVTHILISVKNAIL